ncbi:FecR family protein [Polaribacter litorisediminis]|uniref:FecR family protein n=1 Tax=Polaribacter litorisediminis TaxID=1908341 RepID=UPI001CBEFECE|nr:FecR family protein [Polaribacter litorisediminis]UAM97704.1 FecR family protein [Polaribacter litorisediminis]
MIQNLIFKYLNNQASENEVSKVFDWIEQSEENKQEFIRLKKLWMLSGSYSNTKNLFEWNKIKNKLSAPKKSIFNQVLKYAAVLVLLVAGAHYITTISVKTEEKNTVENFVILEKSSGTIEYISDKKDKIVKDTLGNIIAKKNNKELIYYKNPSTKKTIYNTIKVPFSKTFKVVLSDGTIVHLNAGTSFTYPEQFNLANNRKVSLQGEAHFEVFKDKTKPFIVEANDVNIEVLGTTFNLSNYEEDGFIDCVLTEGSVRLSERDNQENAIFLQPNQKVTWQKNKSSFIAKDVNPENYTAWIHGELVFHKDSFTNISKKIERYYNVKIINNYTFLASQEFTGTIKIKESNVENILELFKLDTPFTYKKKQNIIEIYHP